MRIERLQAREVPFSPNPYSIVIGGNQERVERKRRRKGRREAVYFFQHTRHGKRRGIGEERHAKEHECSSYL
jgi:hypothetical protein